MRMLTIAGLMLVLALPAMSVGAPLTYPCFRASVAPSIDGEVLADPVWANTPVATGFSILGNGYAVAKQTVARMCWDDEALYVGVVCEEPDVSVMKFQIADGGEAWLDDGIELFFQPGRTGNPVYQLVITARGMRTCGAGSPDFTKVGVGSKFGADTYSLEMRIPHSVLSASPKVGDRWGANICRNIFTRRSGGHQFTSWSPLTRQFNEPENFGLLVFAGTPPGEAELTETTNRINSGYRQHLLGMVRDALASAPEYAPTLREAVRDDEYGSRARDVRRRWRRLERAAGKADQAATHELRAVALDADDLLEASYACKWGYMIHKLLREN
ncbi:MAG: hypothetical protein KBI47_13725 [Armatimonadetes bacterium]|jgi:hypothetical protein|nr:hypothetical protein [Armatimonadota bacterium]MDI9586252.1 sugar-binding protein [Acidobacteriota bacterium]